MASRTYALTLSLAGILLFLAVVCANVILDPQDVLHTNLVPHTVNTNDRFERFREYQASPAHFDGLIFGSSRAGHIPSDELSRRLGGVNFANFGVTAGLLTDHLPVLEYVLRQKAAAGRKLRAVFILVDIDYFGTPPVTNQAMSTMLPPELTGEGNAVSLWRQLTTIQFRAWRDVIRRAWRAHGATARPPIARNVSDVVARAIRTLGPAPANAQTPMRPAPSPEQAPLEEITERADFDAQLELLQRFVDLCWTNDVSLFVAIAPISAVVEGRLDPADIAHALDRISEIVPLWDFSRASDWPSGHAELWFDGNHFSDAVGQMMVRRMFASDMPAAWTEFGRYKPRFTRVPAKGVDPRPHVP